MLLELFSLIVMDVCTFVPPKDIIFAVVKTSQRTSSITLLEIASPPFHILFVSTVTIVIAGLGDLVHGQ